MKIALVNPWVNAAENQAAAAISVVAKRLGHEVVICSNTQTLLEHNPDFVLSMSIFVPKLTHIPTYGLIHEPRDIYFQTPLNLRNFVTYDGFFTLADTLRVFTEDLMYAANREEDIGAFYCASNMALDWDSEPDFRDAHLAYFGINWDRRHEELFRALSKNPWMEVYGPPRGWEFLSTSTYKGMTPFDGISNLQRYHAAGAGLCLMTDRHLADDVVSGRIFEITASGAIAIAPRMPWLERNYGDSLLYVDQETSHRQLAMQIERHVEWIHEHPEEARRKAQRSNEIFRERFSLDVMLPDVLAYHKAHVAKQEARAKNGPPISVIVNCSDDDGARRALDSIAAQGYDNLDVTVCADDGVDTKAIEQRPAPRPTVLRSTEGESALWQALRSAKGEDVYVMDGATELLPNHFSTLVKTLADEPPAAIACTGEVKQFLTPFITEHGQQEEIRKVGFFPLGPDDLADPTSPPPLSSLLFRRDLLDARLLRDPGLETNREEFLVLALMQKAEPVFTHRLTFMTHEVEATAPEDADDRQRTEDNARLHLRLFGRSFAGARKAIGFDDLRGLEITQSKRLRRTPGLVEYLLTPYVSGNFDAEEDWVKEPFEIRRDDVHLGGTSGHIGEAILPIAVMPSVQPWSFGLQIHVPFPDNRPYILRVHCRVVSGVAGVGIINDRGDDFLYRVFIPSQKSRIIVNIPVARPAEAGYFVVQAGDGHEPVELILDKVELLLGGIAPLPMDAPDLVVGGVRRTEGRIEYLLTPEASAALEDEEAWKRTALLLERDDFNLSEDSQFVGTEGLYPVAVRPPVKPWAFGMQARIAYPEDRPYVLRVHAQVKGASAAFGILDRDGVGFIYRIVVSSQESDVVVNLAVMEPTQAGNLVVQAGAVYQPVDIRVTSIELLQARAATGVASVAPVPSVSGSSNLISASGARREETSGTTHYHLSEGAAQRFEDEEDWIPIPLTATASDFQLTGPTSSLNGGGLPHRVELEPGERDAGWRFRVPFPDERPYVLRLHARVIDGSAHVAVRGRDGSDAYLVSVEQKDGRVIVDLPIPAPMDCSDIVIEGLGLPSRVELVVERVELFE